MTAVAGLLGAWWLIHMAVVGVVALYAILVDKGSGKDYIEREVNDDDDR